MAVIKNSTLAPLTSGMRRPGDLLQLMLDSAPYTRGDLVDATGQSRTTVRFKLDQLIDAGLVNRVGEAPSTGGRPAIRFAFNPNAHVVLAIDIGSTHARIAVTNLAGDVIDDKLIEASAEPGPEEQLKTVLFESQALLVSTGRQQDLAGVGVGVPVGVDRATGLVADASGLPQWAEYDVRSRVREAFAAPVLIDNDVNLMAWGESSSLTEKTDHLIFLKLASSLSSGIIVKNQIVHGARGMAGNFAHIHVPANENVCECGKTGCLESIASGAALVAEMAEMDSSITSVIDLVTLIRQGNKHATGIVTRAGEHIGSALASYVDLLNPEVVIIGGVLSLAGDPLVNTIEETLRKQAHSSATTALRIETAHAEQRAGVLGAASMILEHVLAPETVDASIAELMSA